MAKRQSCAYLPSKGVSLFKRLKKEYGYDAARTIFSRVITPKFKADHKGTLSLDAEGIPSFESVIATTPVKEYLSEATILKSLNNGYAVKPDIKATYKEELERARAFNEHSPNKDKYTAVVTSVENGIKVEIVPKSEQALGQFKDQYSSIQLAEKLESIFSPLGLTIGSLTEEEQGRGIAGVISFNKIKELAQGFSGIIRVANNMQGALATSEEFSHLLVRMFKDSPLVKRGIEYLKTNEEALSAILGEKYEAYRRQYQDDLDRLAEEALGHTLKRELQKEIYPTKLPLFERIKNWVVSMFKSFSHSEVDAAIYEAEVAMSTLAKQILTKPETISEDALMSAQAEQELYSLTDTVGNSLQEILKKIIQIETKRAQIGSGDVNLNLQDITSGLANADEAELNIFRYLYHMLEQMNSLSSQLQNVQTTDPKSVFAFLRAVRMYAKSYDTILKDLADAVIEDEEREEGERLFTDTTYEVPGEDSALTLPELMQKVSNLSSKLQRSWVKSSNLYLKQFLSDYYDPNTTIKGQRVTLEEILAKCPSDISFSERWLDAMSDSADPLLQTLDMVVKEAQNKIRTDHIKESRLIIALRQKMESLGITSTEWMYERDQEGNLTGNYLSEIDYPRFYAEKKAFIEYLNQKYGKSVVGAKAASRNSEMQAWNIANTESSLGRVPKASKYKSQAYASLSADQKMILEEALALKEKYDKMYPEDRTGARKAIQIRRTSAQRVLDAVSNPVKAAEAVKTQFLEAFTKTTADETEFGIASGLRDFDGKEFFVLPVLYTNSLPNANDLSTDFFSTLLQYSYATLRYKHFDAIVDPMEVARTWIKENRVTTKTRGGKILQETIKAGGRLIKQDIQEDSTTNIAQRIDDYYASQLYGRMMKEGVEVGAVNTNKLANKLIGWTAMSSLSFNWLAQLANVFNGIAMQNIETAARQFFTAKDLLDADIYYAKHLGGFMKNIGARASYDTLSLISEFFNIKQDYSRRITETQNKNLVQRVLGSSISFIGQEAGDHWLYHRTALAILHNTEVIVPGVGKVPVIKALQIKDSPLGEGIREMYIPEGTTNLDGSPFDPYEIGNKIAKINHGLFGVYNQEDMNAAHQTAIGRLALQFRKWMKPLLNRRFQARQYNASLKAEEEGWYRTMFRYLKDVYKSKFHIIAVWNTLEDFEKQNIFRVICDSVQVLVVWLLGFVIDWPDDEDTPKVLKMAELISKRLKRELGALHPVGIFRESRAILKSPIPALSTINSIYDILSSICSPLEDWNDELQSGPYKGMSTLQKNLYKAPVWGLSHYRQVSKFMGDMDDLINYYARPY